LRLGKIHHHLVKLAETAGLSLNKRQIDILAEMNAFNIEGRYPDSLISLLSQVEAQACLLRARRFIMVDTSIVDSVGVYLQKLAESGIAVNYAVVFGSRVRGNCDVWSDIDLLVVSPCFVGEHKREDFNMLWRIAAHTDSRIEPFAVDQRQFEENTSSAIIESARREG
jgi:predicted nucleotidyltransferase